MASHKILVTGGGGYVGGTVITELLNDKGDHAIKPSEIIAIVRKPEIAAKMKKLGIAVSDVSLTDEAGIEALVLETGVHLVLHCASAMDAKYANPLIKALGSQKTKTGQRVNFIHTSGATCFASETGWKHGPVQDTDNIYELEKDVEQPYFVRETNIAIYELAKDFGVSFANVVIPFVYGEGSGEGGRQTILIPVWLKSAASLKVVHKHKDRGTWGVVHINDLAGFYVILIQKILSNPSSADDLTGYLFPVAHDMDMWDTLDKFAEILHAKGVVREPKAVEWPSDEVAAKALNMPVPFITLFYRPSLQTKTVRPYQLGWKPKWDVEKYRASRGDDVEAFFRLSDDEFVVGFSDSLNASHTEQEEA